MRGLRTSVPECDFAQGGLAAPGQLLASIDVPTQPEKETS